MSGADRVVMLDHLRALEDGKLEKNVVEFVLASFANVGGDFVPHVCDESDAPQCRVTTKSAEHVEISPSNTAKPIVRNAVDVDDPGKSRPFLISVEVRFSPENREATSRDVDLRGGQEMCNNIQDFSVALEGIVESWGVDEGHCLPIENELVRELDIGRT